jgi:hypothetical protein
VIIKDLNDLAPNNRGFFIIAPTFPKFGTLEKFNSQFNESVAKG